MIISSSSTINKYFKFIINNSSYNLKRRSRSIKNYFLFSTLKIINPYKNKQIITDHNQVQKSNEENISNNQLIKQLQQTSINDIDSYSKKLQQSRKKWKRLSFSQQNNIIKQFYLYLQSQKNQLIKQLSLSTGKVYQQSLWEVQQTLKMIKKDIQNQYQIQINQKNAKILLTGYGNVLSIYNSSIPLLSASKYLIGCLKSNNSLILAPTFQALGISSKLQQCWNISTKQQFPFLYCLKSQNQSMRNLIDHVITMDDTGFVSFTGKISLGTQFYYTMASRNDCFAQSQFLLESFDAAYVKSDSNIQNAVDKISKGIVFSSGKLFCSIKRVYIDQQIFEQFKSLLLKKIQSYKIGNPISPQSGINLIANNKDFEKALQKIKLLKSVQSLKLLNQISKDNQNQKSNQMKNNFIKPHLFQVLDQGMSLFDQINIQEDFHFPLCLLYKVDKQTNPTQRINFATTGNSFSIFTSNTQEAIQMGRKINVGAINVNTWQLNSSLPYSPRKRSGKGLSFSNLAFNNIIRTKAISW